MVSKHDSRAATSAGTSESRTHHPQLQWPRPLSSSPVSTSVHDKIPSRWTSASVTGFEMRWSVSDDCSMRSSGVCRFWKPYIGSYLGQCLIDASAWYGRRWAWYCSFRKCLIRQCRDATITWIMAERLDYRLMPPGSALHSPHDGLRGTRRYE